MAKDPMPKPLPVTLTKQWLQGMLSAMEDTGQDTIEAAVVKKEGKRILSTQIQGNRIIPKFPDEPLAPVIQRGGKFVPDPDEGRVAEKETVTEKEENK